MAESGSESFESEDENPTKKQKFDEDADYELQDSGEEVANHSDDSDLEDQPLSTRKKAINTNSIKVKNNVEEEEYESEEDDEPKERKPTRKKALKVINYDDDDDDDDADEESEEEEKPKSKKKSKYDEDEEYEPEKEDLARYSRRARKQVNFDDSMFFDSDASSGEEEEYRPRVSRAREKRVVEPTYSSDSDDLATREEVPEGERVPLGEKEQELPEDEEELDVCWNRFILFSRFVASTKEKTAKGGKLSELLLEAWNPYRADKTKVAAFLQLLQQHCKFPKAMLEIQHSALQTCLKRVAKLEALLGGKAVLGRNVPKRLVKSMGGTQGPGSRWRLFHAFCLKQGVNPYLATPATVAAFVTGVLVVRGEEGVWPGDAGYYPPGTAHHALPRPEGAKGKAEAAGRPEFLPHNVAALCRHLGPYLRLVQEQDLSALLDSPEVAAVLEAAVAASRGLAPPATALAWRLTPRYTYSRYTAEPHSKGFWQHGLVRRVVRDVKEGVLGLEAAAWELGLTPDMLGSAVARAAKVQGDLTVQQYTGLEFGAEEQYWGERTNTQLLENVRQRKVDLDTAAFQTGVTLREVRERAGDIKTEEEVKEEKEREKEEQEKLRQKAVPSSKPKLSDLQQQIKVAEKNEANLSEYERMRLENMRERQAMLDMLNIEEDKEEAMAGLPARASRKIDYGVRDKSARIRRQVEKGGAGWGELGEEGGVRHSPPWVGRWWVAGCQADPPRREEAVTGLLVCRGQDAATAARSIYRMRGELVEEEEEGRVGEVEWGARRLSPAQPTAGGRLTTLGTWRQFSCFGDEQGMVGLHLAGRSVLLWPHAASVTRAAMADQGRAVLTASLDGTVRLVDLVADKVAVEGDFGEREVRWVEEEGREGWLVDLGEEVVRVDRRERVTSSLLTLESSEVAVGTMGLHPSLPHLCLARGSSLLLYDVRSTKAPLSTSTAPSPVLQASWAPSGRHLLTRGAGGLAVWGAEVQSTVLEWGGGEEHRGVGVGAAWCPWGAGEVVVVPSTVTRGKGRDPGGRATLPCILAVEITRCRLPSLQFLTLSCLQRCGGG